MQAVVDFIVHEVHVIPLRVDHSENVQVVHVHVVTQEHSIQAMVPTYAIKATTNYLRVHV